MQIIELQIQKNSNASNNMQDANKTSKRDYSILFKSTHPLVTQKIYSKEASPKNNYKYDRTKHELSKNIVRYNLILDEKDLIIKDIKQINLILEELKRNLSPYLKDISLEITIQPKIKSTHFCELSSIKLILSIFKYIQDNYKNCDTLFLSDFISCNIDDGGITDLDRIEKILHNQLWIKKLVLHNNTYLENGNSNSLFHINPQEIQSFKKFILENTKIQTIECLDKNQHLNKKLGLTSPNKTKQAKHNNMQYLFYIIAQGQTQDNSRGANNCFFNSIDKQNWFKIWFKINSYLMHKIPWSEILYDICLYKTKSSMISFREAEPVTYPIRITLDDPIERPNTLEMSVIRNISNNNHQEDKTLEEPPENNLLSLSYQVHLQNTLSVLKYSARSMQDTIKNAWNYNNQADTYLDST